MDDLISRQAAIDAVADGMCSGWDCEVIERLKQLPSAPTIEPRTGHWIASPGMNEQCSTCGKYFPVSSFIGRPFEINYCPHCGTKMEVEHETD